MKNPLGVIALFVTFIDGIAGLVNSINLGSKEKLTIEEFDELQAQLDAIDLDLEIVNYVNDDLFLNMK